MEAAVGMQRHNQQWQDAVCALWDISAEKAVNQNLCDSR
jgi:hypothetical protein